MSNQPDESVSHWIGLLKAGDEEAARQLWERYSYQLVRLAGKRLGRTPRQAEDEQDVAQSVFKSLCLGARQGRFPQLQDRDDLWRLLITITHQKVVNLKRRQGRVKHGGTFKLTDKSFDSLRAEKVPEAILSKLNPLKDKNFDTREVFLGELRKILSEDQLKDYQERILNHARGRGKVPGDPAGGIENRPQQKPTPEEEAEISDLLRYLLGLLRDDTLRKIALWKLELYTNAEIAERLDMTVRSVERKLSLIRQKWGKAKELLHS